MEEGHTPYVHPNGALYCDLMEYLKWRIEAVQVNAAMVREKRHHMGNRLVAEFCLLQLRFCCELLALGCVCIHTDVPQSKRLEKQWNAEAIMKAFGSTKPEFFPDAVQDVRLQEGVFQQQTVAGALTKSEFLEMYNLCGRLLHTGTVQTYMSKAVRTYDFRIIDDFVAKLIKLLNNHTYLLHESQKMIRVIMNEAGTGRVLLQPLEGRKIPDPGSF